MSDFFEEIDPTPKPPAPGPQPGPQPGQQPGQRGTPAPPPVPGLNPGAVPMMPTNPGLHSGGVMPGVPGAGLQNAPMPGAVDKRRIDAALRQAQALLQRNQPQQAYPIIAAVLKAQPHNAEANSLASWIMLNAGKPESAASLAKLAVEAAPGVARFHLRHGMALMALQRGEEAIKAMRKTLRLEPNNFAAMLNLVRLFFLNEAFEDALEMSERAMKIVPDRPDPYVNRGMVRVQIGEPDAGLEDIERAIKIAPTVPVYHENAAYCAQFCEHIEKGHALEIARRAGENFENAAGPVLPWMVDRDPDRPLRVGFLSRDLRRHSCAYFAEPLFEHLDRDRVLPIAYFTNNKEDAVTERFKTLAHEWHDVHNVPDHAVASMIRQHKIDVLIELGGYTTGSRMAIMAAKPAPIQATYMGYPDTTGLSRIDYRLVDEHTDPEGETLATEELVRLPGCFLCYKPHDLAPEPGVRDPDAPFTFGSFNDFKKMTPGTYDMWVRAVQAVPGARLLLKSRSYNDPWIRDRAIRAFADHGLDADRIEIVGRIDDPAGHLALYDRVDIGLETMPYHGTTTTCEAMWMGVPVVTLAGDRHRSRVGVSLLHAVGLPELVAESPDDYVRICTELANDPGRLAALRTGMRERVRSSALVDAPAFCRGFESTLRELWHRWCGAPEASHA